jgi:hypothetical protein
MFIPLSEGLAGDHGEAPALVDDLPADIADFYAWHQDGNLVLVLTWAGYALRGVPPTYDDAVLYGIHIDTDADNVPDLDVWGRFGMDSAGNWGVQVSGIPGSSAPVSGPVEETLESGSVKVWTGLRDDPFFFDKEGYLMTLMTGDVSFSNTRDFALAQNATALVIEFPLDQIDSAQPLSLWATTGRK